MANEVGTASGLEDLFTKIVNFLTTNASLVAADQEWEVLRIRRDNLANLTTNLTEVGSNEARAIRHTFRYDPRSTNNNITGLASVENTAQITGYTPGTSHLTMQLRVTKEVKTVRLICPGSGWEPWTIQNFRLQYSDDGSSWTTALTVNSNPTFTAFEQKDFAVPGTPGAHLYWRVIVDRVQNGSTNTIYLHGLMLLDAGGVIVNHFGSEVILKARGAGGTDAIYTGIRSEYDAANGWYNLFLNGYSGYDPNEPSWMKQPGALPGYGSSYKCTIPMVPCWDSSMPYWFSATGRAFKFALKVSTSFEGGYMGFILPYATPGQYPYPLAIGGSMVPQNTSRASAWRYSASSMQHSLFPVPGCQNTPSQTGNENDTTLYIRNPEGTWAWIGARYSTVGDASTITRMSQSQNVFPTTQSGVGRGLWPASSQDTGSSGRRRPYRECLGGGYILQPLIIHQRFPTLAVLGELDGVYSISGFGNSSENTTSFGGKTHVVFQNAARTTVEDYWALALE